MRLISAGTIYVYRTAGTEKWVIGPVGSVRERPCTDNGDSTWGSNMDSIVEHTDTLFAGNCATLVSTGI